MKRNDANAGDRQLKRGWSMADAEKVLTLWDSLPLGSTVVLCAVNHDIP